MKNSSRCKFWSERTMICLHSASRSHGAKLIFSFLSRSPSSHATTVVARTKKSTPASNVMVVSLLLNPPELDRYPQRVEAGAPTLPLPPRWRGNRQKTGSLLRGGYHLHEKGIMPVIEKGLSTALRRQHLMMRQIAMTMGWPPWFLHARLVVAQSTT